MNGKFAGYLKPQKGVPEKNSEIKRSAPGAGDIDFEGGKKSHQAKNPENSDSKIVFDPEQWQIDYDMSDIDEKPPGQRDYTLEPTVQNPSLHENPLKQMKLPTDFEYHEQKFGRSANDSSVDTISSCELKKFLPSSLMETAPQNLRVTHNEKLMTNNYSEKGYYTFNDISAINGIKANPFQINTLKSDDQSMKNIIQKFPQFDQTTPVFKTDLKQPGEQTLSLNSDDLKNIKPIKIKNIQSAVSLEDPNYHSASTSYFSFQQSQQNSLAMKINNQTQSMTNQIKNKNLESKSQRSDKKLNMLFKAVSNETPVQKILENDKTVVDKMDTSQIDICLVLPYLYEPSDSSFQEQNFVKCELCQNEFSTQDYIKHKKICTKQYGPYQNPENISSLKGLHTDLDQLILAFEEEIKEKTVEHLDLILGYLELSSNVTNDIILNETNIPKIHIDIIGLSSIISVLTPYSEKFNSIQGIITHLRKILVGSNSKKNQMELKRNSDHLKNQYSKQQVSKGVHTRTSIPTLQLNKLKSPLENDRKNEKYGSRSSVTSGRGQFQALSTDRVKTKSTALPYSNRTESRSSFMNIFQECKTFLPESHPGRGLSPNSLYQTASLHQIPPNQWISYIFAQYGKLLENRMNNI